MFAFDVRDARKRSSGHAGWLATLVVAAALGWSAPAAGQGWESQGTFLNLQHTMAVRKAFLQDKELAGLNLGVKVENRVAYLWGPVPSAHALARALKAVQNVPDVLDIRNNLYIDESDEPAAKYLPDHTPPPGEAKHKVLPAAQPAAGLDKNAPATKTSTVWQKAPTSGAVSFKPSIKETSAANEDQALFVLPAIAIPVPPAVTEPPAPASVFLSPAERIALIKAGNPRFHNVQVSLQGTRVYLSGSATEWADVHLLAKAIAQLPGVEHVVIGQVQVAAAK